MPEPSSSTKIVFSFEYYDLNRSEYCLSGWSDQQIKKALERLKEINTKNFNELRSAGRVYHFGEVDWLKTIEKNGFNNKALENLAPFHFALLGVNGQLTRVFGAYSAGIFYIVWFDLDHVIWPSYLKNT